MVDPLVEKWKLTIRAFSFDSAQQTLALPTKMNPMQLLQLTAFANGVNLHVVKARETGGKDRVSVYKILEE